MGNTNMDRELIHHSLTSPSMTGPKAVTTTKEQLVMGLLSLSLLAISLIDYTSGTVYQPRIYALIQYPGSKTLKLFPTIKHSMVPMTLFHVTLRYAELGMKSFPSRWPKAADT